MSKLTILLCDDDDAICTVLSQALSREGYHVEATDHLPTLLHWVEDGKGDVVITDVIMPSGNGLEMLPAIKSARPDLPVIVISAQNTLMTAVKANELGAFDYLPKPFDLGDILHCVDKSVAAKKLATADEADVSLARLPDDMSLIGSSPAMQDIYKVMARMVANDLTVMIEGESGTGKELVARALHKLGKRKYKPFVAVNMAAIPKDLVESELFGHEKGAFTGAAGKKIGKFAQAEGGTLFLDEIGDMPLDAQTKLLRVLQQGEFTPIGSNQPVKSNVRIVCATHRDLSDMIATGQFREDLYYRLNVVPLRVPALRERSEDIPSLALHFLVKAHERGLPHKQLDDAALFALSQHRWPGNVRELENLMYRLAALCSESVIGSGAVEAELRSTERGQPPASDRVVNLGRNAGPSPADGVQAQLAQHLRSYFLAHQHSLPPDGLYERILMLIEKPLIEETLRATNGNQLRAAKVLGINRNTLRKKMQQLELQEHKRYTLRQVS